MSEMSQLEALNIKVKKLKKADKHITNLLRTARADRDTLLFTKLCPVQTCISKLIRELEG